MEMNGIEWVLSSIPPTLGRNENLSFWGKWEEKLSFWGASYNIIGIF